MTPLCYRNSLYVSVCRLTVRHTLVRHVETVQYTNIQITLRYSANLGLVDKIHGRVFKGSLRTRA